jgi:hypothetical protein
MAALGLIAEAHRTKWLIVHRPGAESATKQTPTPAIGRVSAEFNSQNLPDGKVWLEIADGKGQLVDHSLLEFFPE